MNQIKHNLPAATYHADKSVSNSSLKWFRKSPAHYKAWLDGKLELDSTADQKLGTLTHALLLEGKCDWVVHPETYPFTPTKSDPRTEKPWRRGSTYCDEWEALQVKEVINSAKAESIRRVVDSVKNHKLAGCLLSGGQAEVSMWATCPKTGLQLKCRIDYLKPHQSKHTIQDVKKTTDASTGRFSKDIAKWGYHHQEAFYRYVADLCGFDIYEFNFIPVELEPLPMCNVLNVSESDLEIATRLLHRTLEDLAMCYEADEWAGYVKDVAHKVVLPAWAHGEMVEETLTGAIEV